MTRGGQREGAGRKPRLTRYHKTNERVRVGKRALLIGQRCEVLWREAYPSNFAGMHLFGDKRPRARKRIIRQVVAEFGETPRMIERLWADYRRLEKDLAEDL